MLTFDREAGRFRDENGNLVPVSIVMANIERVVTEVELQLQGITKRFTGGEITNDEWLGGMRTILDSGHIAVGTIAAGGEQNITPVMWAAIAGVLLAEYRFLLRLARQRQLGAVPNPRMISRARLYAFGLRRTLTEVWNILQVNVFDDVWCKRVRTAGESCPGCVTWEAKGWLPYSEMAKIGSLQCKQYCKCYLIFREGPPPVQ